MSTSQTQTATKPVVKDGYLEVPVTSVKDFLAKKTAYENLARAILHN